MHFVMTVQILNFYDEINKNIITYNSVSLEHIDTVGLAILSRSTLFGCLSNDFCDDAVVMMSLSVYSMKTPSCGMGVVELSVLTVASCIVPVSSTMFSFL